jgi:hypothetical protein
MNYNEALGIVEHWIEREGIRTICSTVCKGRCCTDQVECAHPSCFDGDRKLECSVFVCPDVIFTLLSREDSNRYFKVRNHVEDALRKRLEKKMGCHWWQGHILWFGKMPVEVKNEVRFDEEVVKQLLSIRFCKCRGLEGMVPWLQD